MKLLVASLPSLFVMPWRRQRLCGWPTQDPLHHRRSFNCPASPRQKIWKTAHATFTTLEIDLRTIKTRLHKWKACFYNTFRIEYKVLRAWGFWFSFNIGPQTLVVPNKLSKWKRAVHQKSIRIRCWTLWSSSLCSQLLMDRPMVPQDAKVEAPNLPNYMSCSQNNKFWAPQITPTEKTMKINIRKQSTK